MSITDVVVNNCRSFILTQMHNAGYTIDGCQTFGSHCYGLELATSDVDIAVLLAAEQDVKGFLEAFRKLSSDSEFTREKGHQRGG